VARENGSGKPTKAQQTAARKLEAQLDQLPKCGMRKASAKRGPLCKQPAGLGTDHLGSGPCWAHEMAEVQEEANGMAKALEVTPGQAMAGVLHLAAGQLAYITDKVAGLQEDEVVSDIGTVNAWVRLLHRQMELTMKTAKWAADAGIDERMMNLAEAQTAMMASLLEKVAGELNLTKTQQKAFGPAVRKHLTLSTGS
jgi:hypothetical protein